MTNDRIEKRIEKLEKDNEQLIKISILLEQQIEISKRQTDTLEKVAENLSGLNFQYAALQKEVDATKSDLKSLLEIDNVSFVAFVKKYMGAAALGVVSAIVGAVMLWLGFR